MDEDTNDIENVGSKFASMDTDYIPKTELLKDIQIHENEDFNLLVVAVPVVDDYYFSIIRDDESNNDLIKQLGMTVVGHIKSKVKLSDLLYGLNHPTRVQYKSACGALKMYIDQLYIDDDKDLRTLFSQVH